MTRYRPSFWLHLAIAFLVCGPARSAYREGSVLRVPADFATIQQAVDGCMSNDRILVMGRETAYWGGVEIDARRIRNLTLMADPEGPRPVLTTDNWHPLIDIDNVGNVVSRFTISGLELDGHQVSQCGINVQNGWANDPDSVFTNLTVKDMIIRRCKWGIEIGERSGTLGCDGVWGAIDRRKLNFGRSSLTLLDSIVAGCGSDGLNLYRVNASVRGNLIVLNGDEGCHTTDAVDLDFRHNIVGGNPANNLHLQGSSGSLVRNNLFVRSVRKVARGTGGYGIVVGGTLGDDPARIENNVIIANANSGLRIQPAELVLDSLQCLPVQAQVDVRNNIFENNGYGDPGEYWEGFDIFFQDRGLPGMELTAEYNFFVNPIDVIYGAEVDETNVVAELPEFVAEPDTLSFDSDDLAGIMRIMDGYALEWFSAAVDVGDPGREFEDASGGLARGTVRCDMGLFGGPEAVWPYQRPETSAPAVIPVRP